MLQTLAGRMLNIKPSDVFIRYSSEGRPYLDSSELFLNLSHCDGKCVVLISDIRAGCDLQSVRPFGGEAVRAFFSEKDFDHIAKSDDPDFEMTRIWCIREALYKFPGAELPDIGLFLKKVSASDRAAFSEEYGIRLFEERIDDLILAVVTEKAVDTDSLEIKRFQDNIMM
ncbi:MAG: 4'-phosphopantetheinyl transferase superfamily protein [Lachnospiraceae bacterium]|nr:4'-phosphopantetheinyl transferase superfamily protein [Lachnospiraceae bacterium]